MGWAGGRRRGAQAPPFIGFDAKVSCRARCLDLRLVDEENFLKPR